MFTLFFSYFLIGFSSIIAQLVLIRELSIVFYGQELFIGLTLSTWLILVALGNLLGNFLINKFKNPLILFAFLLILTALFLPLQIVLVRLWRVLFNFGYGEIIGFWPTLYSVMVTLLPLCLVFGANFTIGVGLLDKRLSSTLLSKRASYVYFWESLGAIAGGLVYTFFLVETVSPLTVVLVIAFINLSTGLLLLKKIHLKLKSVIIIFMAINTLLLFKAGYLEKTTRQLQWKNYNLIKQVYSRYGHLAITRTGNLISLFENGFISATFPNPEVSEEAVHWPFLIHPNPQKILLIGGGYSGILKETFKYEVEKVDYLELDPLLIKTVTPYLSADEQALLANGKVNLINQDARKFIKNSKENYDLILINVPEPLNAQINRFYTLEFYQELKQILKKEGIISLAIPSAENYLNLPKRYFISSLYKTLNQVFPYQFLVPGEKIHLIAGNSEEVTKTRTQNLVFRLVNLQIKNIFIVPSAIPFKLTTERIDFTKKMLSSISEVKLNRDIEPISYYYYYLVWQSQFRNPFSLLNWLLWISLSVWYLLKMKKRITLNPVLLAITTIGFSAICLEIILLLVFQSFYGYLYHIMGLYFALFMAGLTLGSAGANYFIKPKQDSYFLLLILICFILISVSVVIFKASTFSNFIIPILLFLVGSLVGMSFPLGFRLYPEVAKIYASDLAGAALGGFLTSVIFVPLLGFITTAGLIAALNLISLFIFLQFFFFKKADGKNI